MEKIFYTYFDSQKNNKMIKYDEIIDYFYSKTNRVEASFSSKMLATINPEMPILDSQVLLNMGLKKMQTLQMKDLERQKKHIE